LLSILKQVKKEEEKGGERDTKKTREERRRKKYIKDRKIRLRRGKERDI
jgi:hypothetical protein